MKSKLRFNERRKLSFISVFLIVDLLIVFAMLRTSNAIYVSSARGEAPMDVALYAFEYDGLYEVSSGSSETAIDVNLGDMQPGDVKYFKFTVTNKVINDEDEEIRSDTNISYKLKVITTTNIMLNYGLYYNELPWSATSTNLLASQSDSAVIIPDGYGTKFKHYTVDAKCMSKDEDVEDVYYLKVVFPADFIDYKYQDLVESIKIQLDSKQVLTGDPEEALCS